MIQTFFSFQPSYLNKKSYHFHYFRGVAGVLTQACSHTVSLSALCYGLFQILCSGSEFTVICHLLIVPSPNTIIEPLAVMVKFCHTFLTAAAVFTSAATEKKTTILFTTRDKRLD